jgi:hypothetical protein
MSKKELTISLDIDLFKKVSSGVVTEIYMPINYYWCRRLLSVDYETDFLCWGELEDALLKLNQLDMGVATYNDLGVMVPNKVNDRDFKHCLASFGVSIKNFIKNAIRIGYKKIENQEILSLEHMGVGLCEYKGINCFVIKNGEQWV